MGTCRLCDESVIFTKEMPFGDPEGTDFSVCSQLLLLY